VQKQTKINQMNTNTAKPRQTMRNYLRNKPNYSDLLMSAVTFLRQQQQ